jgi:hypothetical protein
MLQSIRRGKYLEQNDQKATYEFLKRRCKKAAEARARDQPSAQAASLEALEPEDCLTGCNRSRAFKAKGIQYRHERC